MRLGRRGLLFFAILFGVAPLVAALIRVVRTGYDYRYLWVAIAAFIGATIVMVIGKARVLRGADLRQLIVIALVVSVLLAMLTGRLLGASAIVGIGLVAVVYALFFTTANAFFFAAQSAMARPQPARDTQ